MSATLSYGLILPAGRIISVREAQRGQICACFCPKCKEPLVARQGPKNDWHFAHTSDKECKWAAETALHLLCKQIIADSRYIRLSDKDVFCYKVAEKERTFPNFRADVWIESAAAEWIVEIFVTHEVTPRKTASIKNLNISALEIDVSRLPRDISMEELKAFLLDGLEGKTVLYKRETVTSISFQWPDLSNVVCYIVAPLVIAYLLYRWLIKPKRKRYTYQ